jgi:hypothetical protein
MVMTHKHNKKNRTLIITLLFSASGLLLSASQCELAKENFVIVPTSDATPSTGGMTINDSKVISM